MASPIDLPISERTTQETRDVFPYQPALLDRFMNDVEHLPVPYWLTYLALFIVEALILHIVSWLEGWLAPFTSNPILFTYPLWQWATFAIMTYLDRISLEALSSFAPLLNVPHEALERLKYEFTTLPAKSGLISALFWGGFFLPGAFFLFPSFYAEVGIGMISMLTLVTAGLLSFCTGGIIYYHSIRQLRLVHRTVSTVKHFDLFRLDPVYAFSKVTSRTAIAWVLLLTVTLLTFPVQFALAPTLLLMIFQIMLAIAAFALPLWSVNHRLVVEKRVLLAEHNQRVKRTLARLHEWVDQNESAAADQLNYAIAALNAERDILIKIPTWPWRAGLLTGFLSVIGLPIITFLIQLGIQRWLIK